MSMNHKNWQALQKFRLVQSQQKEIHNNIENKPSENKPSVEIWKAKRNLRYYLKEFNKCLK